MSSCNRAGQVAIVSVKGWVGGGVYRESSSYFQTFHSSNFNSKAGTMDPKLYFCIYFGAAFSFNRDRKMEQLLCPLCYPAEPWGRLAQFGGDRELGEGDGNG